MNVRSIALVLVWLAASPAHAAPSWQATVTHVTDGDTLWVKPARGGRAIKIRMHGIDAPEICQAGGQASRAALASRVRGRVVSLNTQRIDDYGRVLATVHLAGVDVGASMVASGQAWSYRFRREGGPYMKQQTLARAQGRGLFADRSAMEPRLFRQGHGPCKS